MKILFRTKEQANKEQEVDFLSLKPEERFYQFLALSKKIMRFPVNDYKGQKVNDNFIISFDTHGKKVDR